jgi:4-amino-4-deoxy-L-arabinose transferase-like glycosyltransferase
LTVFRDIASHISIDRFYAALARAPVRDGVLVALYLAAAVFPLIFIRAYHYEEGLTAALAKDALTGSPWYVPDLFGVPWLERPVLQSWIVAAISVPLGGVSQLSTRLPTVAALLATCFLILSLVRPRASRLAALVAALAFLFSPAILQKIVTAEADVLLTAFQFAAFVVWWRGYESGRVGLVRWLVVGLLLAATALCKGPQPAAFFPLGVGVFILVRRDWRQLAGFVLAGIVSLGLLAAWYAAALPGTDTGRLLGYMRLTGEQLNGNYFIERAKLAAILLTFLPGLLLALPALAAWLRRREPADIGPGDRTLFLALTLYAGVAAVALFLWPGAATRYAMPAMPAVAALGGLAFDRLSVRRPTLTRASLAILSALAGYQLVWGWIVAPSFADRFATSRINAGIVAAATRDKPYALYAPLRTDDALLVYLDGPVRYVQPEDLATLPAPSFFLAHRPVAARLAKQRPDLDFDLHVLVGAQLGLYEVQPR